MTLSTKCPAIIDSETEFGEVGKGFNVVGLDFFLTAAPNAYPIIFFEDRLAP